LPYARFEIGPSCSGSKCPAGSISTFIIYLFILI
jgi:hypothetical protein